MTQMGYSQLTELPQDLTLDQDQWSCLQKNDGLVSRQVPGQAGLLPDHRTSGARARL